MSETTPNPSEEQVDSTGESPAEPAEPKPQPGDAPPSPWKERWRKLRPYLPFVAFVCGFIFDSITLGRQVSRLDLYLVSGYAVIALIAIVLRELPIPAMATRAAGIAMQFSMGGCLSALVVLYFKSAGSPLSLILMVALFVTMVANEFMHRDEPPQREYVLALWVVAAAMLGNFVVPHIVKSVSALWFYACVAAAVGIVSLMRTIFRFPWKELRFAFGAAAMLTALWALGFVPPVPLVYKNNIACTNFKKSDYSCDEDEPGVLQSLGITNPTVTTDGAVYCLTAVFAPREVEVTMEHRWYQWVDGDWKKTDDMDHPMRGGREDGWRFWSRKRNIPEGEWKVETALKDGPVLGYQKFEVVSGSGAKRRTQL